LQAFAKHSNYSYYGLEGFINAKLMAEALRKAGRDLSREKLVTTLESTPFDLGGYKINYSPTSHNGSRFVDLTVLGRDGRVLR
jgi:ABC-type branched-subunit amino acid transport system substrate-binding protein